MIARAGSVIMRVFLAISSLSENIPASREAERELDGRVNPGTKTAQSVRVIPVQDDIQDAIRAQGSGRIIPCNPDALRNRFERAISNSGVTPFTFHQLRHKFASDLMLQGIPDVYIEYLGGWKHGSQVLKRTYQQAEKDRAADMLRSVW